MIIELHEKVNENSFMVNVRHIVLIDGSGDGGCNIHFAGHMKFPKETYEEVKTLILKENRVYCK